jgi:O-antigen/teichoic acid export membrane protein
MGEEFASGATPVLQAFLVAFGFTMISVPGTELARGADRPGLLVAYTGLLAVVNLAGTLVLSRRFGVQGAAGALLAAQTVGAVFLVATSGAARELLAGLVRPIGLGSLLALVVLGIGILTDGLVLRTALAIGVTALYAAAAYRFGVDAVERGVLLTLLARSWRPGTAGSEAS